MEALLVSRVRDVLAYFHLLRFREKKFLLCVYGVLVIKNASIPLGKLYSPLP